MVTLSDLRDISSSVSRAQTERAETLRAHQDAVAGMQYALQQRRLLLQEYVGPEPSPERMKAAARALGLSTARIYQLTRDYGST